MPIVDAHLSFHDHPTHKYVMACPRCCKEFYHLWLAKFTDSGDPIETCPDCGLEFPFERKHVKKLLIKKYEDQFKVVFSEWR